MSEPQYRIKHQGTVQGPFPQSKVLAYIRSGRVRKAMQFSLDGAAWVRGSECPELFPVVAAPPPLPPSASSAPPAPVAARASSPHARPAPVGAPARDVRPSGSPRRSRVADRVSRGAPAGFGTASVCDFVFAGVAIAGGGYVAWRSGAILKAVQADPNLMLEHITNPALVTALESLVTMGWVFVLAGVVAAGLGIFVRSGHPEARTTQLVASFLLIGVCVWALVSRWVGFVTLACLASQAVAIFVMFGLRSAERGGQRRRA